MTATTTTNTPTATDAYIIAQAVAADQLEALKCLLAEHQDNTPADKVNWGHVGDIGYVNAQLAEAIAFLTGYQSMQQK